MSVETQLSNYRGHFEAEMTDVTLDQVTSPRPVIRSPGRWWRAPVAAVAAAMAVLVLIGGVALMAGRSDETLPVGTVPSDTGPDSAVPDSDTTVVATSGGWSYVTDPDVFGVATFIDGVVAGGPGFVAAGELLNDEGSSVELRVWVSGDGVEWMPVTVPVVEDPASSQTRWRLAAGPIGMLLWSVALDESEPASVVLFSVDGYEWVPVTMVPERIHAVAASEQGFIAIGGTDQAVEVSTSSDGLIWTATAPDVAVRFDGVTSWNDQWVAWSWGGFNCETATACDGFWVSTDGDVWTELAINPAAFDSSSVWDMGEFRGELYAVGTRMTHPAVWASSDGISWELVFSSDTVGEGWGIATGDDMIAITASHTEEALDRPDNVWMSADGRTWRLIGSEDTFATPAIRQLAISGNRIVAAGIQDWEDWPPRPALLLWTASN
jgi:hypothetical protein